MTGFPRADRARAPDLARLPLGVPAGSRGTVEVTTIVCAEYSTEIRGKLIEELTRRRLPR